ncbi:F-box/kelch-repeat protein SKIP11-like isoform X2 [Zingiber officinale]|uniref:F-box/kelch-repeat protein SKIP11-like isoform X2 n=1 Tax=Zingiber officinale TaxID=94328 RepID=UPI001C4D312D|nr:F-box/kelch-repeat protein SKIP11-like isoform X2 [Zingiber officinale]
MIENECCLTRRTLRGSLEQESEWAYMTYQLIEIKTNKRPPSVESLELDEAKVKREKSTEPPIQEEATLPPDELSCPGGYDDGSYSDTTSLISQIGRDMSIKCLLHCSRSNYGTLASLNRAFNSLIQNGELYKLRRQAGIIEHWVYFSCNILEWEAYDPYCGRWISLPRMPPNDFFMCSDKESLAVGTELLVFGRDYTSRISHILLRYSILTNSWSQGVEMNYPRCLFGSASFGERAIVAGGIDARGVFMDNKFYVIGGMSSPTELLTCGEEYDMEKCSWRIIPNMSQGLNGPSGAPPLVSVVNNELYAADYAEKEVRKYDKENITWITLGKLPERPDSVNGWGLAFRACGERLIVIGGPRMLGGGTIELNSWTPRDGPPVWNMIASKHCGNFVYNCAVMGC